MSTTIGIPCAMLHLEFDGALAGFVTRLGHEVVLSPPTNRSIFERGKRVVLDELCFPIKVFMGHVAWLTNQPIDRILIPVLVGHENDQVFPCHMRTRLADMAMALSVCERGELLAPSFRFNAAGLTESGFVELGRQLGATSRAIAAAIPAPSNSTPEESLAPRSDSDELRVAVLGHPYVVKDAWVNGHVASKLRHLGCEVITDSQTEFSPRGTGLHFDLAARSLAQAQEWDAATSVDGIVFLLPFNCGPDGDIARHMLQTTRTPMLTLVLDELQSDGGVLTRLEAFVDQLALSRSPEGAWSR